MRRHALVSIVMPAYNRARWLPMSVASVARQTFHNWELIIVDDRSTDDTHHVIQEMQRRETRIRCIANERTKGPSGARNQGIHAARGKYIAYLDSDDEWMPFHLELMVYYLEKYSDRIDVMNANILRRHRSTGRSYGSLPLDVTSVEYQRVEDAYFLHGPGVFDLQLRKRVLITQTIVGKYEMLSSVRWREELPSATDCMYCLEIVQSGARIGHLQQFHANYWAHDDNLTNCGKKHHPDRMIAVTQGFVDYLSAVLTDFELSDAQREYVRNRLAGRYFWGVGYNCYLALGEYREARKWFRKGLRLQPMNPAFWKVFLTSYLRQALNRRLEFGQMAAHD